MAFADRDEALVRLDGPAALRDLSLPELDDLSRRIREFLVQRVSATGGHLGPNLGVVELTLALHRVFDSPTDAIIWDTGHQSYVHKIVTGRAGRFDTLRQAGGLSGYPSRAESPHDWVENSHASAALSYADGIAKAWQLQRAAEHSSADRRHVVAVVGDGSLTGGMAWEALNNIAAADRPLVIVVNDNERSYSPTIGGVARHLATLRTSGGYERFLHWVKRRLRSTPVVGRPVYDTLHGVKKGVKDMVAPQGLFEDLGLKYIGPVDGHDIEALERHLESARSFDGPVIVHVITRKGKGYAPAEQDEADRFHGVGIIHPETGAPRQAPGRTWTTTFSEELVAAGAERRDVVAITAAMPGPTGLAAFAERYPQRFYDVGIAEQHAVTSAAGLAMAGMHPVVAVYSTFLNRAYDQMLLDVAAHGLPVTVVLDRSGITGDDGASHNGMWDLSMLAGMPGVRVAAPRDAQTLREHFREALDIGDGPTVVRFPKGVLPDPIVPIRRSGSVDVLAEGSGVGADAESEDELVIVAIGSMAGPALAAADLLREKGTGVTVVDPRWVLPISRSLGNVVRGARWVVTVEDGLTTGGVGAALAQEISPMPVLNLGIDREFLAQGRRADILASQGLTGAGIAESIEKWTLNST